MPRRRPRELRVPPPETEFPVAHRDVAVAERAAEESGVLSVAELRDCGLDAGAVHVRTRNGRLHRQHRGVYAVGHTAVSLEGRFAAAVKACGPQAVLSHLAAAAFWKMLEWDESWPVDVTVAGVGTRRHRGIRVHLTSWLESRDVMVRGGLGVTAPWRTVLDVAAILNEPRLRRLVRQALSDGAVSISQLADARGRGGPRRGAGRLGTVLAGAEPTRSELEDVVLDLILSGGFERPDINKPLMVGGRRLIPDFRWPEARLIVEADGAKWHANAVARRDDAEREALLVASGERVLHVTWAEAVVQRHPTLERLALAGAPIGARDTSS